MSFGGYDLNKFAKDGKTDSDIHWADIGSNEAYWTMNAATSNFGKTPIAKQNQMVILDNGMSLAMAPKAEFKKLIHALHNDHQINCIPVQGAPVFPC
jgi:hypothetical protein